MQVWNLLSAKNRIVQKENFLEYHHCKNNPSTIISSAAATCFDQVLWNYLVPSSCLVIADTKVLIKY